MRKYKSKLLIKPAKKGIKTFLKDMRESIKNMQAASAEQLIHLLNPKIQGWATHYRSVVAKAIFKRIDHRILYRPFWSKAI